MIIKRNKNWKSTWRTSIAFLCILLLWTLFFVVWINMDAEASACQPNDPSCNCDSESSASASAMAEAVSESNSYGVGISFNEIQVDSSDNSTFTNTNNATGGSVEIIEGDTILNPGDTQIFVEGTSLTTGETMVDSSNINNISNDSIYDPGIIFPDIPTSELQIGDVRATKPSVMLFGGVSDANHRGRTSGIVGVGVHIPWPDKHSDEAFRVAKEKLENERDYLDTQNTYLINENKRLQAKHDEEMKIMEREHQARFVILCTTAHKGWEKKLDDEQFNELFNFCDGIEHKNNEEGNRTVDKVFPEGPHNQEMNGKANPNQFMPHSNGFLKDTPVMIDASMSGVIEE